MSNYWKTENKKTQVIEISTDTETFIVPSNLVILPEINNKFRDIKKNVLRIETQFPEQIIPILNGSKTFDIGNQHSLEEIYDEVSMVDDFLRQYTNLPETIVKILSKTDDILSPKKNNKEDPISTILLNDVFIITEYINTEYIFTIFYRKDDVDYIDRINHAINKKCKSIAKKKKYEIKKIPINNIDLIQGNTNIYKIIINASEKKSFYEEYELYKTILKVIKFENEIEIEIEIENEIENENENENENINNFYFDENDDILNDDISDDEKELNNNYDISDDENESNNNYNNINIFNDLIFNKKSNILYVHFQINYEIHQNFLNKIKKSIKKKYLIDKDISICHYEYESSESSLISPRHSKYSDNSPTVFGWKEHDIIFSENKNFGNSLDSCFNILKYI
jgi:hypothetical protein